MGVLPLQDSLTGIREIVQHISFLLSQGGHDGHHSLDKERYIQKLWMGNRKERIL